MDTKHTIKIEPYRDVSDNDRQTLFRWKCTCGATDQGYDMEEDALEEANQHAHRHVTEDR